MLIHHGLQVSPLPLLSSGGLSVPTPLPCVSPRVLLGYRRLLLSPQQGTRPSHWLVFVCPHAWYSSDDLNICKCCNGAPSKETPTTAFPPTPHPSLPLSSSLIFPALFLFVSFLTAASSAVWGRAVGTCYGGPDLLCHRDLFKRGVRLMTVN